MKKLNLNVDRFNELINQKKLKYNIGNYSFDFFVYTKYKKFTENDYDYFKKANAHLNTNFEYYYDHVKYPKIALQKFIDEYINSDVHNEKR